VFLNYGNTVPVHSGYFDSEKFYREMGEDQKQPTIDMLDGDQKDRPKPTVDMIVNPMVI